MNYQNKVLTMLGAIFGGIGALFLALGLIFRFAGINGEMMIVGIVFTPIGGAFLLAGLIILAVGRARKKRIKRLKSIGECYDAEIVRIRENLYMHAYYRHPIVVECVYKDRFGKSCLVKSKNIWPTLFMVREDELRAKVWVNPDDPKDYYVEVLFGPQRNGEETKIDYDYR